MKASKLLSLLGAVPLWYAMFGLLPPGYPIVPTWYYIVIAVVVIVGVLQIVLPQLTPTTAITKQTVNVLIILTTLICFLMVVLLLFIFLIGSSLWQ
ncbi:MAG: hypothetical protein QG607_200 [Patescibacteria group bacterium]|nr:hypothetical protein [Patescibacteria group bacterium]